MSLLALLAIILVSYASFAIEAKYLPVHVGHTKYGIEITPIRNHKEYAVASAIIESDMFLEPRPGDTASQMERVSQRLKANMKAADVLYVPSVLYDIYALHALGYGDAFARKEHNFNVYKGLLNYVANAAKDVSPDKQILLHSTSYGDVKLRSMSDFNDLIRNFLAKFTVKGGHPHYVQNEITRFYYCLENVRSCHNSAIRNSIMHEYQAAFDNDKYLVYLPSTDPTETGFKTSGVDILLEDEEHKLFKTWFSFKTKFPGLSPISLHLWPGEIPRGAVKDRGLFYDVKLEVLGRSDDTVFSMENL